MSTAEQLPELFILDSAVYQDTIWCANCGGERIFLQVYEFESGRVGVCLGCGEERIQRFSRSTSEEG